MGRSLKLLTIPLNRHLQSLFLYYLTTCSSCEGCSSGRLTDGTVVDVVSVKYCIMINVMPTFTCFDRASSFPTLASNNVPVLFGF